MLLAQEYASIVPRAVGENGNRDPKRYVMFDISTAQLYLLPGVLPMGRFVLHA